MMQPDGSSARDHIPRANWRSFVPPQIAAILGTTRHCVLLIARGSTAIFSVFCGTDERFCFDPPRDREERCALNRLRHPDKSAGSAGFSGRASGSTEIGRASCRERVSVRVDIGGRGILKKKQKVKE